MTPTTGGLTGRAADLVRGPGRWPGACQDGDLTLVEMAEQVIATSGGDGSLEP